MIAASGFLSSWDRTLINLFLFSSACCSMATSSSSWSCACFSAVISRQYTATPPWAGENDNVIPSARLLALHFDPLCEVFLHNAPTDLLKTGVHKIGIFLPDALSVQFFRVFASGNSSVIRFKKVNRQSALRQPKSVFNGYSNLIRHVIPLCPSS